MMDSWGSCFVHVPYLCPGIDSLGGDGERDGFSSGLDSGRAG